MPRADEVTLTAPMLRFKPLFSPLVALTISVLASAVSPHETVSPTVGWLEAQISHTHTQTG